ncbi:MAG TPA: right-handed parallel beta-helix repeat-containing protein, partial [bacterium]
MKRGIAAIITCLLVSTPSFSVTLHVPSQYPTIRAGINAAQDYDTVLVAAGGYYEHIDFLGKEIVVKSESGAELTAIVWAGQENVVTMNSGEGAVLEGFTIQNDYPGDMAGCGIYCGPGSWPTIGNNRIIECGSIWCQPGGGISAWSASPHIEDNLIAGNMCAYYGAGIQLSQCFDVVIRDNVIANNYTASGYGVAVGGGIYADSSEGLIERNLFVANIADPDYGYGGAIAVAGSGWCQIWRNTFSENVSGMNNYPTGGGICLGPQWGCSASIFFEDNILVNSSQGGGFSLYGGTPILRLDFNDVWNNQPFNYYGCTPGPFDISADPLFEGGSPYSYELTANSPCVDAGSFMANPDPDGTRADIGAYPFNRVGMNVSFQPYFWPINIPANGGWFAGHFFLTNNTASSSHFDFWV